ncbi:MAG: DUF6338 family protein [Pseudodesulfovibrio sp.]
MNIFESVDTFQRFVLIVVPGITAIIFYGLLRPRKIDWSQVPLEATFYGFLTFVLFNPIFEKYSGYLANIVYFFIAPVALSLCFYRISRTNLFNRFFLTQSQTAWDHCFSKKHRRFVIATLKDGGKIGGYYGGDSAASCYPHDKEIYLRWTYKIDSEGNPIEMQPDTDGILIGKDAYDYIEFKTSEENDG